MAATTNLTVGSNLLPKTSGDINLGDSTHKWVIDASQISGSVASATAATTATKFASSQSVALTGDVTGSASSQAGWSITTTLANSGVTAGSYGHNAAVTLAHGGAFNIPYVTVDKKGRVTSASNIKITLPGTGDTDYRVSQNVTTTSANYPLLLAPSGQTTNTTTSSFFGTKFQANPNTGYLYATAFSGSHVGSGASLTSINASNISSGTLAAARLATSGVTAGSYGTNAAISPGYSGSFNIPYVTIDTYGRVTGASNVKITLPATSDTKMTQTVTTTSANYPLLLAPSGQTANATTSGYFGTKFQANPNTGTLYATTFSGAHSGSGASLSSLNASNISSGTLAAARLATSGVTAATYGPTANVSATYGGTFNVPKVVVDTYGRVTSASNYVITMPAASASTGWASGSGSPSSSQTASVYVDTTLCNTTNQNPAGIYIRVS